MNQVPVELPYDTCVELLSSGVVGRVATCTTAGPRIVPVNYAVVDGAIVFRTTPYSVLGTHGWAAKLAFEVDHIDPERREGWSVVASGRGRLLDDPEEIAELRARVAVEPWAGGSRQLWIALEWTDLTGRRIGAAHVTRASA